jgi:CRISPR-associated protein Cas5d
MQPRRDTDFLLRVWGPEALFANPHFRADPVSYPCATQSAAHGIVRALFWKPEIHWEVTRIHVLAPIRFDTTKFKSVQAKLGGAHTLQTCTYLVDVDYIFEVRLIVNHYRTPRTHHSYKEEAQKRFSKGQHFRQPTLGRREYTASWDVVSTIPDPVDVTIPIGPMMFAFVPPAVYPTRKGASVSEAMVPVAMPNAILNRGTLDIPDDLFLKHRDSFLRMYRDVHPNRGAHADVGED